MQKCSCRYSATLSTTTRHWLTGMHHITSIPSQDHLKISSWCPHLSTVNVYFMFSVNWTVLQLVPATSLTFFVVLCIVYGPNLFTYLELTFTAFWEQREQTGLIYIRVWNYFISNLELFLQNFFRMSLFFFLYACQILSSIIFDCMFFNKHF